MLVVLDTSEDLSKLDADAQTGQFVQAMMSQKPLRQKLNVIYLKQFDIRIYKTSYCEREQEQIKS